MNKVTVAACALSAVALVGIGVLFGASINSGNEATKSDTGSSTPPAQPIADALPSVSGALSDLLATDRSSTLQRRQVELATGWAQLEFTQGSQHFRTVFVTIPELDEQGAPEDCHACAPALAAATYHQAPDGRWMLARADQFVARLGGWGKPLSASKVVGLPLGSMPGMDVGDGAHFVFAYAGAWRYLGMVPGADNNSQASECEHDKRCWSWTAARPLKVSSTESHGFPDLILERQGTIQDTQGRVIAAPPLTYQFTGDMYYEKGKIPTPRELWMFSKLSQDSNEPPPHDWYVPDANFSTCFHGLSPAERIKMIQDHGTRPRVTDLPDGAVEVTEPVSATEEQVSTYYPTEEACVSSLPRHQSIPSRYR